MLTPVLRRRLPLLALAAAPLLACGGGASGSDSTDGDGGRGDGGADGACRSGATGWDPGFRQGLIELPGVAAYVTDGAVLDHEGRVVVFGRNLDGLAPLTLFRLGDDGELDGSFGEGGIADFDLAVPTSVWRDAAVDATGRILVIGDAYDEASSAHHHVVARVLSSGALDPAFADGGVLDLVAAPASYYEGSLVTALATSGSDVYVARSWSEGGASRSSFDHIDATGTVDPSFAPRDVVRDVVALNGRDGKLYVAGFAEGPAVAKLAGPDALDRSWGDDGIAAMPDDSLIYEDDLLAATADGGVFFAMLPVRRGGLWRYAADGGAADWAAALDALPLEAGALAAVAESCDGTVVLAVSDALQSHDGPPRYGVARLSADGVSLGSFGVTQPEATLGEFDWLVKRAVIDRSTGAVTFVGATANARAPFAVRLAP